MVNTKEAEIIRIDALFSSALKLTKSYYPFLIPLYPYKIILNMGVGCVLMFWGGIPKNKA